MLDLLVTFRLFVIHCRPRPRFRTKAIDLSNELRDTLQNESNGSFYRNDTARRTSQNKPTSSFLRSRSIDIVEFSKTVFSAFMQTISFRLWQLDTFPTAMQCARPRFRVESRAFLSYFRSVTVRLFSAKNCFDCLQLLWSILAYRDRLAHSTLELLRGRRKRT